MPIPKKLSHEELTRKHCMTIADEFRNGGRSMSAIQIENLLHLNHEKSLEIERLNALIASNEVERAVVVGDYNALVSIIDRARKLSFLAEVEPK